MRPTSNQPKSNRVGPAGGIHRRGRTQYWFFNQILTKTDAVRTLQRPEVTELDQDEKQRRLEAVLFLSPEGISSRKAAKLAGLADATEARTLIRQLNLNYDKDGRPFRVEDVAGGYALLTRSNFAPWLRRLSYMPAEVRLGQSAVETLAVVAYRQPVLRANIESIRGVGCNEVLKYLMELDLVRISGRSEDLGRPYLYSTTRRFLQMFGLRSADRLPRIDWVNGRDLDQNGIVGMMSSQQVSAGSDSEAKESTVKMSFSATALLESGVLPGNGARLDPSVLPDPSVMEQQVRPVSAVDDDDDDFDDDEDDDIDDDDDDWDDDDDDDVVDDDDDGEEVVEDADEDEVEADDAEDSEWEEVDDDGEEDWDDDDDDDDDDDWDEDDDEDEDEDWD